MRHFLRTGLFGIGALWLAASAQAQYGRRPDGPYTPNGPYNRNDPYYSGRSGPAYRGDLIDRVLSDLDRARSYNREGRNRKEFEHARQDLLRFRENLARGRFDRGRLDSAIKNVDRLVNSRWLSPQEREMLSRDVYALRDFRSNRGYQREGRYPY
jgi:hypothetical protein